MDYKYECMSITKSAVGLAYLMETKNGVKLDIANLSLLEETKPITITQALCHYTGVENDASFDYDEFMKLVKKEDVLKYAENIFIKDYHKKYTISQFKYNNIVWRILVNRFYQITNVHVKDIIKLNIPGVSFETDTAGYMHGLNGMKMTLKTASVFAKWAESILRYNKRRLLLYPKISRKEKFWGNLFGNKYNVHCFYGWFIATHIDNPNIPLAAVAVGFMSQFICIDLTRKKIIPGIQLRKEYWKEGNDSSVHNFAKDWINEYN